MGIGGMYFRSESWTVREGEFRLSASVRDSVCCNVDSGEGLEEPFECCLTYQQTRIDGMV